MFHDFHLQEGLSCSILRKATINLCPFNSISLLQSFPSSIKILSFSYSLKSKVGIWATVALVMQSNSFLKASDKARRNCFSLFSLRSKCCSLLLHCVVPNRFCP